MFTGDAQAWVKVGVALRSHSARRAQCQEERGLDAAPLPGMTLILQCAQ
jgi:hypothetical protein